MTAIETSNGTWTSTWTPERVDLLRRYVGNGMTCAQVAREIGVSRNAVIGKINRLGLSRGRRPAGQRPECPTAAPKRLGMLTQRRILRAIEAEPPAQAAAAPISSAARCSLLELAHGKCRWPISSPGAADFCFCGNAAVAGLPYCPGHARMAYRLAARQFEHHHA
jgi:GcrA cell cycle regulator